MTAKPLLVVRHVPWEGPHRILAAFPDRELIEWGLWEKGPLPAHDQVCGAVFMGGPMSANDTATHPRLAQEIVWLGVALATNLPVLGICLGAQLLARAAGGSIGPGEGPEIGIAPVEILAEDPLLDALAPAAHVLHWHGERFALPPDAVALARSALTPVQAFRAGECAWGLLFHPEADDELVENWLAAPDMAAEAKAALGADYAQLVRAQAAALDPVRADAVFTAFARHCV